MTLEVVIVWALYVALEPWVRRYWPQRASLRGRARWVADGRDPVVGRDILGGMVAGSLVMVGGWLPPLFRFGSAPPLEVTLLNLRLSAADVLSGAVGAVILALFGFLALFFARAMLRNQWVAAILLAGLVAGLFAATATSGPAIAFAIAFVLACAGIVTMMRLGLLVAVAGLFTTLTLTGVTTNHFTAWYGQGPFLSVIVLSAMAVWAFRTSLGGQKLLG